MSRKYTKFHVSKDPSVRTYDGIVFDSILEMRYYKEVVLPGVASGEITSFELQKKYQLQPSFMHDGKRIRSIDYIADFVLQYADGREVVVDTKGKADQTALLKRKLFYYHYPTIDYQWIAYSKIDGGWIEYDKLKQNRKERKKEQKENE